MWNISSRFGYLEDWLRRVWDLTVYVWTIILLWGYPVDNKTSLVSLCDLGFTITKWACLMQTFFSFLPNITLPRLVNSTPQSKFSSLRLFLKLKPVANPWTKFKRIVTMLLMATSKEDFVDCFEKWKEL